MSVPKWITNMRSDAKHVRDKMTGEQWRKGRKETDIVRECLNYLKLRGVLAWRTNTGGMIGEHKGKRRFVRFGIKGMADICGVLPGGRALFVECKTPIGKLSQDQAIFGDAVKAAGAIYAVVRDLDDFGRYLDENK